MSDCKDIQIDWSKIIKSVRIDKHCSSAELKSLQQAYFAAGINPDFKNATMMGGNQSHNTPPANSAAIPFELFCIDDMRGTSRLRIK